MIQALDYVWQLFVKWIALFSSPAHNFELLWIIIPIYLNWIFTEFYQEKKGTSLGNAISNGFVPMWVGIDWGKTTYLMLQAKQILFNSLFVTKMIFSALMMLYGIAIIILGIRVKKVTHYLGKIRVVTYVSLMLTPIYYGVVRLDWNIIISILAFFPLFYFLIELIDRKLPNPKTYDEDEMPPSGRIGLEKQDLGLGGTMQQSNAGQNMPRQYAAPRQPNLYNNQVNQRRKF